MLVHNNKARPTNRGSVAKNILDHNKTASSSAIRRDISKVTPLDATSMITFVIIGESGFPPCLHIKPSIAA
jgi:hypothetical protein